MSPSEAVETQKLSRPQWLLLRGCELVLLAYFLSTWQYKTWYIVLVAVFAAAVVLGGLRWLRMRGVFAAAFPVALYFAYLYVSGSRAEYPDVARWWALADSILILVAALFWLLLRNVPTDFVSDFFVRMSIAGAVIGAALTYVYWYESRAGGYGLAFAPEAIPFCWAGIIRGRRRGRAIVALLSNLMMVIVSRSRTPIVAAALALFLSVVFIGRGVRQRLRNVALAGVIIAVSVGFLLTLKTTRYYVATVVVRFTHQSRVVDGVFLEAEPEDAVRKSLTDYFREHVRDAQPFGIGYQNMMPIYARELGSGEEVSLHSMYQVWLLEGGVVCVLIVAYMLVRQFRALWFAMRRASSPALRLFARCACIGTIALLLLGAFHQMHRAPFLYMMLGLGVAARDLARERPALRRRLVVPKTRVVFQRSSAIGSTS